MPSLSLRRKKGDANDPQPGSEIAAPTPVVPRFGSFFASRSATLDSSKPAVRRKSVSKKDSNGFSSGSAVSSLFTKFRQSFEDLTEGADKTPPDDLTPPTRPRSGPSSRPPSRPASSQSFRGLVRIATDSSSTSVLPRIAVQDSPSSGSSIYATPALPPLSRSTISVVADVDQQLLPISSSSNMSPKALSEQVSPSGSSENVSPNASSGILSPAETSRSENVSPGEPQQTDEISCSTNLTSAGHSRSIFEAPLAKLKRKAVSKLFSVEVTPAPPDEDEFPSLEASGEPSHRVSGRASRGKLVSLAELQASDSNVAPPSFKDDELLEPLPSPRPFPLVRSMSSSDKKSPSPPNSPSPKESGPTSPGRPRSRTLSSLTGDSRSSAPFGRTSFGSLLSGRLRSETDMVLMGKRPSPSPRPSASPSHESRDLLPERIDDESPEVYLVRLKETTELGSSTAATLSKSDDAFHREVLQRYSDTFDFTDDPLDMALRKFLMYVRLPKETQQIDRVLESFAMTYNTNNPGIYLSCENAYIVVFSLVILHTDFFNKNNRHKMLKNEFVKNTYAKGVPGDVLEVGFVQLESGGFFYLLT
jgi:hypothetical protein